MIDQECVGTVEGTQAALDAVEAVLAVRMQLAVRRNVRAELVARDLAGVLEEDALVRKWHKLYCGYLDWLHWENVKAAPPRRTKDDSETKAAEAAFAV